MFDFRERIKEEKKRLNISAKSMAARSELQIQEETISRFLTGKTADPGTSVTLDLGATVGLKPHEIFMDSQTAAEFRAYLDLKSQSIDTDAANVRLLAENDTLASTNTALAAENDRLRIKLSYLEQIVADKDQIIADKDEIIALYIRLLVKE